MDAPVGHPGVLDDAGAIRDYARTGDPRLFEGLVRRYEGMVLATCRRTIGSESDAQDAAQETFLALARAAAKVRSNVGAWLHVCAVRTSIDLMRARGVRHRAEHAAARPEESPVPIDDPARAWRELEPLVDAALASLSADDRELIIARFMLQQKHADIAAARGVHPGTIDRQLDRAVERLRTALRRSGSRSGPRSAAGAAAPVGTFIHDLPLSTLTRALDAGSASSAAVPAAVTDGLIKIGLAGVGSGPAPGASIMTILASLGIGAACVGIIATAMSAWQSPPPAPAAAKVAAAGTTTVPRPSDPLPRLALAQLSQGNTFFARLVCRGRTLRVEMGRDDKGVTRAVDMRIDRADATSMTLTVTAHNLPPAEAGPFGERPGKTFEATYTIRDGRANVIPDWDTSPKDSPRRGFLATRPISYAGPTPEELKDCPVPQLAGAWHETPPFALDIDADSVRIGAPEWAMLRFRILGWQDAGDHAVISTICTGGGEPALVGKRMKLLYKPTPNGAILVHRLPGSKNISEPPDGFDPTPNADRWIWVWNKETP